MTDCLLIIHCSSFTGLPLMIAVSYLSVQLALTSSIHYYESTPQVYWLIDDVWVKYYISAIYFLSILILSSFSSNDSFIMIMDCTFIRLSSLSLVISMPRRNKIFSVFILSLSCRYSFISNYFSFIVVNKVRINSGTTPFFV